MTSLRSQRFAFLWLALTGAFLLGAALPSGWMPASSEGAMRIVLCTGAGPLEVRADDATRPGLAKLGALLDHAQRGGHSGDDAPRDPCPFGVALSQALDVPPPPAVLGIPALAAQPATPDEITARLVAARNLRPPARGPPRFA
ncbi:MAG: hypothetical protein KUG65_05000 [Sphingomonadaceae bacterium]|nr:hypothetical protein [Sphingomonadaceae bacterium]